ncbi:hypothetical protein E2C01_010418 [Portunus trituberculatus]|uniref:Uncharacterized protein n=1 Tax=Portunus trituberculatus TaxID=210409 RepID=A0A5B7D8K2_PORTR|nr:hypothetical protein [Portunus trituberculatus]
MNSFINYSNEPSVKKKKLYQVGCYKLDTITQVNGRLWKEQTVHNTSHASPVEVLQDEEERWEARREVSPAHQKDTPARLHEGQPEDQLVNIHHCQALLGHSKGVMSPRMSLISFARVHGRILVRLYPLVSCTDAAGGGVGRGLPGCTGRPPPSR